MLTASPRCTERPLVVPSVPTLPPWPVVSSVLAHRRLDHNSKYGISVLQKDGVDAGAHYYSPPARPRAGPRCDRTTRKMNLLMELAA